jgi:putative toxin-antitoxin system toxin component, PIN family
MKAVVDTNVLVSGLLSGHGPPGKLINAIETGLLIPVFSEPILFEYLDVLLRPGLKLERGMVSELMEIFYLLGDLVDVLDLDTEEFTDKDDVPFYAAAMATQCPLITGNLKHFPRHGPVKVLSPRRALELLAE